MHCLINFFPLRALFLSSINDCRNLYITLRNQCLEFSIVCDDNDNDNDNDNENIKHK